MYPYDRTNMIGPVGIGAVLALLCWASLVSQPIPPMMLKRVPLRFTGSGYTCYMGNNWNGGSFTLNTSGATSITVSNTGNGIPICWRGTVNGE